jgi:hypothetical protein
MKIAFSEAAGRLWFHGTLSGNILHALASRAFHRAWSVNADVCVKHGIARDRLGALRVFKRRGASDVQADSHCMR